MHDDEVPLVVCKAVGWLVGLLGVGFALMTIYIVYDALRDSTNYAALLAFCGLGIGLVEPYRFYQYEATWA